MNEPTNAIVVGGSAGAMEALRAILPALVPGFSVPIALVLHVPSGRASLLPDVLGAACALEVREAEDKEPFLPGSVYVAPPDYHLLLERSRMLSLSVDPPVLYSRPSIDVLFESAAAAYGRGIVGVLLSGANEDGARGLARVVEAGGTAIVQAPATAAVREMPESGLRWAPTSHVLSPAEIGARLAALGTARP